MYAIVQTSGKQYKVAAGDKLVVDRMQAEIGDEVELAEVLMIGGDGVKVGSPTIAGAKVVAKVVEHKRGDKVVTLKYRRRHRTRRKVGFRAALTTLEILRIDS